PLFRSWHLSGKRKLRALGDLFLPRGGSDDESLESFVLRRLGPEMLERVAQPLVAGIHAAEPSTMSLRASFPRFLDMEREHRSLFLAARAARKKATGASGSHFVTFARGMGQLIDALVEAIGPAYVRAEVAVTIMQATSSVLQHRVVV